MSAKSRAKRDRQKHIVNAKFDNVPFYKMLKRHRVSDSKRWAKTCVVKDDKGRPLTMQTAEQLRHMRLHGRAQARKGAGA